MSNVSLRDSKQTIFDALQVTKKELDTLKTTRLDPAAELVTKNMAATVKRAEEVITKDILNPTIIDDYKAVMSAIAAKKTELKDLFGLSEELMDMATALNAHKALVAELDEDRAAKEEEYDEMIESKEIMLKESINNLQKTISDAKAVWETEKKEYEANLKKERDREKADYTYNLNRERQLANDKWADEKAAREKELRDRENQVEDREVYIAEQEDEIAELKAKVADIPNQITAAVEKTAADAKKSFEASKAIEINYIKKDNENQLKVLQYQIDTLNKTVTAKDAEIIDLKAKLDASYDKIQTMATKTVESAGNSRMVDQMRSIAVEKGTGK
jgi:uncharacterized coiled-coil protein SlyX